MKKIKIYDGNNAGEAEHLIGQLVMVGFGEDYFDQGILFVEGYDVRLFSEIIKETSNFTGKTTIQFNCNGTLYSHIAEFEEVDEKINEQLAAISTAAGGHVRTGDAVADEYNTPAFRDVLALYDKYDALRKKFEEPSITYPEKPGYGVGYPYEIIENRVKAIKLFRDIFKENQEYSKEPYRSDPIGFLCKALEMTKEQLIRYLVCDGEPADESCVGHPVLVSDYFDTYKMWEWDTIEIKLTKINSHNGHTSYEDEEGLRFLFAKKKPGYDYTQEVK